MTFLLNYVFAWIAVLLGLILLLKYILRKRAMKPQNAERARTLNRKMRKPHIVMGIAMTGVGLVHGIYSSDAVLSLNLGTVAWVVGLLSGVNYALRKRMRKGPRWLVYHRLLAVLMVGFTVIHVVDVGGIQILNVWSLQQQQRKLQQDQAQVGSGSATSSTGEEPAVDADGNTPSDAGSASASSGDLGDEVQKNLFGVVLADGTYTGSATGYGPNLTVEVTVQDNQVRSIEILSHYEVGEQFYGLPMAIIPDAIIKEQSLDVDTISGATYTSIGILNAVRDALSQGVVSGELPPELPAQGRNRPRH